MACTKVKIAVLAPMPRAIVRMTVAAKPGDFANWRRASLRVDMICLDAQRNEPEAGTKCAHHRGDREQPAGRPQFFQTFYFGNESILTYLPLPGPVEIME